MITFNEAINWSIERLKMELHNLEREYDSVARDLRNGRVLFYSTSE